MLEQLPQPALLAAVKRLTGRLEPVPPDPADLDVCQTLHELWWKARERRSREAGACAR
jgi:hypothetical protein